MSRLSLQYQQLEAALERLRQRVPDVPIHGILLSRLILHAGRCMAAMLDQQIRPFGLTEPEFRVLTTLFSQPDGVAHPSELGLGASQSPANMSRISDALVARELITRVPSARDRRKMVLRITERGEELVQRLLPTLFLSLRESLKEFPDADQRQLVAQLRRLGDHLGEAVDEEIG